MCLFPTFDVQTLYHSCILFEYFILYEHIFNTKIIVKTSQQKYKPLSV